MSGVFSRRTTLCVQDGHLEYAKAVMLCVSAIIISDKKNGNVADNRSLDCNIAEPAGMTYLKYSSTCANLVRNAVKESLKVKTSKKAEYSMLKAEWEGGQIKTRTQIEQSGPPGGVPVSGP